MNSPLSSFLLLCCATVLVLSSCSEQSVTGPGEQVFEVVSTSNGSAAAGTIDFVWNDNGATVNYKEFVAGKKHVVNIWGTWCGPCRKELPDLVEFSKSNPDIQVIGIALEQGSDPVSGLQTFCRENNLGYVNITGSREVVQPLVQQFGNIQAVPTTLFFNSDGSLSATKTGQADLAGFNSYASELY